MSHHFYCWFMTESALTDVLQRGNSGKTQNATPISSSHISSPADWNPLQSHCNLNQNGMMNRGGTVTNFLQNIHQQSRAEYIKILHFLTLTDSIYTENLTSLDSLLAGPSRREYRTSFPPRKRRSRYSSRKTAVSESWPWWPLKMDDLLVDSRSAERGENKDEQWHSKETNRGYISTVYRNKIPFKQQSIKSEQKNMQIKNTKLTKHRD